MKNSDKIKYVFRKDMSLRFHRGEAYWAILKNFYGAEFYATRPQLLNFFRDLAGIEREIRNVLKLDEFKLPAEADKKRYEKASEFKQQYPKQ